jgi:drug/metabolite transporter (DMT)-like permease
MRRRPVTQWSAIKHLAFCGLIAQALPFTLFAWAEHHISSVAAGLVNSTTALWTGLLAIAILPEERLNRIRAFGLTLGFIGVAILLGIWDATFKGDWFAYLACALATIGYAISSLWIRKHVAPMHLDPYGAIATQLFFSASFAGIVSLFASKLPTSYPVSGVAAITALGALGTGAALVLNFLLIQRAGAMATSTVTYSIPIVSTIAGAVVLHEAVHWYEPAGAVIIMIGIAIVQGLLPRQRHTLTIPAVSD